MSEYDKIFQEAIDKLGFKKVLTLLLFEGTIIDKDSVGQIIAHINCGGVTKVCYNLWEIK